MAETSITLRYQIEKVDADKHQVFGWASTTVDAEGKEVVDKQGDVIETAEIEQAAYDFVLHSGRASDQHKRQGVGDLIESLVVDAVKKEALGIVGKREGWWVGFRITDETVWSRVKSGDLSELSIGGEAVREDLANG